MIEWTKGIISNNNNLTMSCSSHRFILEKLCHLIPGLALVGVALPVVGHVVNVGQDTLQQLFRTPHHMFIWNKRPGRDSDGITVDQVRLTGAESVQVRITMLRCNKVSRTRDSTCSLTWCQLGRAEESNCLLLHVVGPICFKSWCTAVIILHISSVPKQTELPRCLHRQHL